MMKFSPCGASAVGQINSRHQDTLVFALIYKVSERAICHGVYMWLSVLPGTASIHVHDVFRIYWERTVWINGYEEEPRVGLRWISVPMLQIERSSTYIYQVGLIPSVQVVDDGGFVEMRELRHIVRFVKLSRVHLIDTVWVGFTSLVHQISHLLLLGSW